MNNLLAAGDKVCRVDDTILSLTNNEMDGATKKYCFSVSVCVMINKYFFIA